MDHGVQHELEEIEKELRRSADAFVAFNIIATDLAADVRRIADSLTPISKPPITGIDVEFKPPVDRPVV